VHMDSNHTLEHTLELLAILKFKIKHNGIICGHDFYDNETHQHAGVKKAVLDFCNKEKWHVFHRDNHSQWAIKKILN
ncbi:MAG: hypothetical protein KBC84_10440, partial [Proteobacteria bacterium]|nr:hypothetical protein [Pseudomonadota bacterium]